jgi:hypothetical protein
MAAVPLLDWRSYARLASENGIGPDALYHATQFLHDAGELLYFCDMLPLWADALVISPQYALITLRTQRQRQRQIEKERFRERERERERAK